MIMCVYGRRYGERGHNRTCDPRAGEGDCTKHGVLFLAIRHVNGFYHLGIDAGHEGYNWCLGVHKPTYEFELYSSFYTSKIIHVVAAQDV